MLACSRSLPDHDLAPLRKDDPAARGGSGAIEMGVEWSDGSVCWSMGVADVPRGEMLARWNDDRVVLFDGADKR